MEIFKKSDDFCRSSGIDTVINNSRGVLVALSGGADSSLLLKYLICRYGSEKISACHVNHMIRGKEADRDESFCREVCRDYGIKFFSKKINVPEIAEKEGLGTEEAARRERYAFLTECAAKADGAVIATAHNATDNLETLIFNLCRGSGLKGLGGIAPVRDNIVRPLLSLTAEEIREACDRLSLGYVTDSTNLTCDYTRNYIRHEIVPKLRYLNPLADRAALRTSRIARESFEYIAKEGQKLIESGTVSRKKLRETDKSVAVSALQTLYTDTAGSADSLSEVHLEDAYSFALTDKNGELSMPHKIKFMARGDTVSFGYPPKKEFTEESLLLPTDGRIYPFGEYFAVCAAKDGEAIRYDENIYNLFIKHTLCFDTIDGSIFVRCRQAGDSILRGKFHKKLKKLMCEKNVPEAMRDSLPIFCDGSGIFLVPGAAERSGTKGNDLNVYVFRRKGIL